MATSSNLCGFCFLEPVYGFCENCNQRLCSNCFSIHSRSSGHITFQVDNVAHIKCDPVSREVDIHEQKCPLHKTDYQSLYCGKHDIAICGRCIRADHMFCSDSIIDLHDITFDEHCLNGSLSALKECEQEINAIKTNVAEHDKSNDECKATYLHSIKECRKNLDARLDQLQSIVASAGESKYKQNNSRLRTVEEKCEETLNRIRERTDLIQDLSVKRQIRHLYVISRRLEKEILEFNAAIRQSNQENHIEQFNFVKNSKLEHLLHEGINEFGTLREECDGSEEVVECGTDVQQDINSIQIPHKITISGHSPQIRLENACKTMLQHIADRVSTQKLNENSLGVPTLSFPQDGFVVTTTQTKQNRGVVSPTQTNQEKIVLHTQTDQSKTDVTSTKTIHDKDVVTLIPSTPYQIVVVPTKVDEGNSDVTLSKQSQQKGDFRLSQRKQGDDACKSTVTFQEKCVVTLTEQPEEKRQVKAKLTQQDTNDLTATLVEQDTYYVTSTLLLKKVIPSTLLLKKVIPSRKPHKVKSDVTYSLPLHDDTSTPQTEYITGVPSKLEEPDNFTFTKHVFPLTHTRKGRTHVRITDKHIFVVAIHIGTSFTGLAFSGVSEPAHIRSMDWSGAIGPKVPTTVLIRSDGTSEAFGYEAEKRYAAIVTDGLHRNWYFFKNFAIQLFSKKETIGQYTTLEDETGKTLEALHVFSMTIQFMKDRLLTFLNRKGFFLDQDIHWVLTFPMWHEHAEEFMRMSARQAGIENSNLSIIMETEAVVCFFQHWNIPRHVGHDSTNILAEHPGKRYLVCDAGVETMEITVIEVTPELQFNVIQAARRRDCGWKMVNEGFEKLLDSLNLG